MKRESVIGAGACLLLILGTTALADDWPEWRGKGRTGVWNETGIIESFPSGGLKFDWRMPIHGGYAGPAVSEGRIFVTEFENTATEGAARKGAERALCLEETSGKTLWKIEWPADYGGLTYNSGPRATPTVDSDRVYLLGSMGDLICADAKTGDARWRVNFVKDFNAQVPIWGFAAAPLVDGPRLICLAGADPDAKVLTLDKMTGEKLWGALSANSEPGYVAPMMIEHAGVKQLIVWEPDALSSLNPETGAVYWSQPFQIKMNAPLASPVFDGRRLFVSAFYNGPMMMELDADKPSARVLWKGTSDSEIKTDGLHACHATPVIKDNYIYGVCSYGQFRCLNADTGERIWESMEVTIENRRWAAGHIVRNGDRYFINNDRGDLIIANLQPDGYHEISRTFLIKPTTGGAGKRDMGGVNWTHPAYANRHIITRNDEEILRSSLEKE